MKHDSAPLSSIRRRGLLGSGFYGLLAPAHTPADIVAKLHASIPQGYSDFMRNEIARWTPVVKAAGITPE